MSWVIRMVFADPVTYDATELVYIGSLGYAPLQLLVLIASSSLKVCVIPRKKGF